MDGWAENFGLHGTSCRAHAQDAHVDLHNVLTSTAAVVSGLCAEAYASFWLRGSNPVVNSVGLACKPRMITIVKMW
jgi:hypothetical protein